MLLVVEPAREAERNRPDGSPARVRLARRAARDLAEDVVVRVEQDVLRVGDVHDVDRRAALVGESVGPLAPGARSASPTEGLSD